MTDPQRLEAGTDRYHGRRRLRLHIIVESFRGVTYAPVEQVSRAAEPSGTDIVEGHPMIGIAEFALNAPTLNFYRDATGVREVLWVEAEDGNTASVQFENDGIGMLIVVVRDNQNCVRH